MADDRQDVQGGNPSPASESSETPRNLLMRLRVLPLFASLTDEQFRAVANLLRSEQAQLSTRLIQQGGLNTNLYILRRGLGALRALDASDREQTVGQLQVGDIFNEAAFLTGLRNSRTVEALQPLVLWYIPRDTFQALLIERPDIQTNLHYPENLPPTAPRPGAQHPHPRFDWQHPNEQVVLFSKKHPWVYWRNLWPLAIAIVTMLALGLLVRNEPNSTLVHIYQALIGVLAAGTLFYAVYQFVDWQNDYYVVTDQRVVHRERTPFTRDRQSEVPMNKIQDVGTDRPGLLSYLLDYGDVTIDASGLRARVRFKDVPKPNRIADALLSQSTRTQLDTHATQRAKVRAELISELRIAPGTPGSQPVVRRRPAPARQVAQRSGNSLGGVRNTLAPYMRAVQGDSIIYRKHWLRLLEVVSGPILGVVLYVAFLVLVRTFVPDLSAILFDTPVILAVVLVGVALLFTTLYRYEDWRNDIYILTSDRVVDIDRSPFGLGGSTKREARLTAIQNVNSDINGVWDNAFNMGTVIIQTAGSEGTLRFESVHDPRGIQRDILERMEALDARVREAQSLERRREFAEWVGIYDELKKLYGDGQQSQ